MKQIENKDKETKTKYLSESYGSKNIMIKKG